MRSRSTAYGVNAARTAHVVKKFSSRRLNSCTFYVLKPHRASVVNKGACDSSGPVQGNLQADEPPVQAARISTDSGTTDQNDIAAGSKGRKVST